MRFFEPTLDWKILVPIPVALVVSFLTFADIALFVNFLYSLGMLLEFHVVFVVEDENA